MKSWKTTTGGWLLAIGTSMTQISDPVWVSTVGAALVAIGGIFMTNARDNGVSSESAGAI